MMTALRAVGHAGIAGGRYLYEQPPWIRFPQNEVTNIITASEMILPPPQKKKN